MIKKNGYQAMITQQTWMFSSSFKNLRMKMMQNEIVGMIHLGSKAFDEIDGEVVQTTAFVCYKGRLNNYSSIYFKLDDYGSPDEKEIAYLHKQNCYIFKNWKFQSCCWIRIFQISKPIIVLMKGEKNYIAYRNIRRN